MHPTPLFLPILYIQIKIIFHSLPPEEHHQRHVRNHACEHARNHRKRGKAKPGHQASYLFIGLPFSLPTPALALLAVELTQINERSVCHSCLRLAQGSMFSSQMLLFLSVNLFKMLQLQKDKKAVKPF